MTPFHRTNLRPLVTVYNSLTEAVLRSRHSLCQVIFPRLLFQVSLGLEKSGERLGMEFPIDIGTIPFRIPNGPTPQIKYGGLTPIVTAVVCLLIHTHLEWTTPSQSNEILAFTNGHAIYIYNSVLACRQHIINSSASAPPNATKIAVKKDSDVDVCMFGPEF